MTANLKQPKKRIDLLLVERNLVESREKAQALILAGKVKVDGRRVDKPGQSISTLAGVEIAEELPYVSRGGFKLAAALDHFRIDPRDRICLDVGTSTGGFVDCLLQRGAARVHAVDTGVGQIDWKLRGDPRVVLHERCNARYLASIDIGEPVTLLTCDVSFISVTLLLPALFPLVTDDGDWIVLVKPQFEIGREQVGKGGIVRDPAAHLAACRKIAGAFEENGFTAAWIESPILGAEGNREFLLHARRQVTLSLTPVP